MNPNRLWIWLASLNDSKRGRLASVLMAFGLVALVVGVFVAHGGSLPSDAGYLESFPRGWPVFTAGHIIAFGGSQLLLAGIGLRYVAGHKLTWARAGFAAFIAFFELILLWGVVPSEWLNLTQGPLGWTSQDALFTLPVVDLPVYGAFVKDAIAGGYHLGSLAIVIYFAVMVQKWGKMTPPAPSERDTTSPYGRPLKVSE